MDSKFEKICKKLQMEIAFLRGRRIGKRSYFDNTLKEFMAFCKIIEPSSAGRCIITDLNYGGSGMEELEHLKAENEELRKKVERKHNLWAREVNDFKKENKMLHAKLEEAQNKPCDDGLVNLVIKYSELEKANQQHRAEVATMTAFTSKLIEDFEGLQENNKNLRKELGVVKTENEKLKKETGYDQGGFVQPNSADKVHIASLKCEVNDLREQWYKGDFDIAFKIGQRLAKSKPVPTEEPIYKTEKLETSPLKREPEDLRRRFSRMRVEDLNEQCQWLRSVVLEVVRNK